MPWVSCIEPGRPEPSVRSAKIAAVGFKQYQNVLVMAHAPRGRFSFGTSDMRRETDVQEINFAVSTDDRLRLEKFALAAVVQKRESRIPRSVPLVTPSPFKSVSGLFVPQKAKKIPRSPPPMTQSWSKSPVALQPVETSPEI